MPKGGSGANPGGVMPESKSGNVSIKNERAADGRVVGIMTQYKIQAAQLFPELKGQIYDFFNKITQGDIDGAAGYYSPSEKKIAIDNAIAKGSEAQLREVTSHELAHALSINTRRGFRSNTEAFDHAFKEYKRSNPRATEQSFARKISGYAATSKEEAFAEAFRDYTINEKGAAEAAKLIMKNWRR